MLHRSDNEEEGADAVWASRQEAVEHQVRRFSSPPVSTTPGSRSARGASVELREHEPVTPEQRFAGTDVGRLRPARYNGGSSSAKPPDFVPSLKSLSEELASLEMEVFTARQRSASALDGRMSSAPVTQLTGGLGQSPPVDPPRAPSRRAPLALIPPSPSSATAERLPAVMASVELTTSSVLEALHAEGPDMGSNNGAQKRTPWSRPGSGSSIAGPPLNATVSDLPSLARHDSTPRCATPPAPLPKPFLSAAGPHPTAAPQGGRPVRVGRLTPITQPGNELRSPAETEAPPAQPLSLLLPADGTQAAPAAPPPAEEDPTSLQRQTPAVAKERDGRIKVVVRKRPLPSGEDTADSVVVDRPKLILSAVKQRMDLSEYTETSEYAFDDAFDDTATNREVYEACAKGLVDVTLGGGSASIFAYGQTGSGKTHTMMGTVDERGEGEKGLYLLGTTDLLARLSPSQHLSVSFYEIYCNSLYDLLNNRAPVVLREDGNRKINIRGLSWKAVASPEELWCIVMAGLDQRRTGSTSANERSSRSHAIMTVRVGDTNDAAFEGSLNFVDLAGSERGADTANNDKLTRLEGAEINKSLLALKECIRSLDEKRRHVPFRGSRLTEVLRDSFTGNSRTVMIATVSPSSVNYEHTANTLRYAFRVKGLSIASVAPSKARNAPRPFQLGQPAAARNRSRFSASPVSATRLRSGGGGEATADAVAAAAGATNGDGSSAQRQRASRERRATGRSHSKQPRASPSPQQRPSRDVGGAVGSSSSSPASPVGLGGGAPDTLSPLTRRPGRRRELPSRRDTAETSAISLLDLNAPRGGDGGNDDALFPLVPTTAAAANAPLTSPTLTGRHRRGTHGTRERSPAPSQMDAVLLEEGEVVVSADALKDMEARMKVRILRQLRQDLGSELQDILDERDSIIAALRAENARLRETVSRLEERPRRSGDLAAADSAGNESGRSAAQLKATRAPYAL